MSDDYIHMFYSKEKEAKLYSSKLQQLFVNPHIFTDSRIESNLAISKDNRFIYFAVGYKRSTII